MTVSDAMATLGELEAKHTRAMNLAAELATERRRIAFEAHTGDAAARVRLDEVNLQSATLSGEIESLAGAVHEARARVAEAQREVAAEAEKERQGEALEIADRLRRHGAKVAAAAAALVKAHDLAMADMVAASQLGYRFPNSGNARVLSARAMKSEVFNTGLQVEALAPNERLGFAALFEAWARRLESEAGLQRAA